MTGVQLLVTAAIFTAIVLGYRWKINVGLVAIGFAYLIGSFVMGLSPKEVIEQWPISLFLVIFAVGLFYNFAAVNGTLDQLAAWLLYQFRGFPSGIYVILFVIASVLAATGTGFFTTMAVFAPIAVRMCMEMNKSILIGAQAVNWGAAAGANIMTSGSGVVYLEVMTELGFGDDAFERGIGIFLFTLFYPLAALGVLWVWERLGGNLRLRSKTPAPGGASVGTVGMKVEKPGPFNRKQKQTLALNGITFILVLVIPVLNLAFPGNSALATANQNVDIALICIVMSVVALVMRLADQKEVIAEVPWNTIIMISGMGTLMGIAVEAGLVETISGFMTANIPLFWLPVAFAFAAGVLSFFSSTLAVVVPTLFPVVVALSAADPRIDATLLFTAVVAGALSTNNSPFSSGGAMMQTAFPEHRRAELFNVQITQAVPITFATALVGVFLLGLVA